MCADLALQLVRCIVHVYSDVCKEKKRSRRERQQRERAMRRDASSRIQTLARSPELEKKIYEFVCVPSGHSRVLGEEHRESVVKKNIFVSKSATFQRNTSRVLPFPRDSTAENFEGGDFAFAFA